VALSTALAKCGFDRTRDMTRRMSDRWFTQHNKRLRSKKESMELRCSGDRLCHADK
jgi:hypothetical protein